MGFFKTLTSWFRRKVPAGFDEERFESLVTKTKALAQEIEKSRPLVEAIEESFLEDTHLELIDERTNLERQLQERLDKISPSDPAREWLLDGDWIMVASSNVDEIKYDYREEVLTIRFLSGAEYEYYSVPITVARDFYHTSSPGRFVWNHLRDQYPYKRTKESTKKGRQKANVIRGHLPSDSDPRVAARRDKAAENRGRKARKRK